eukprot:14067575-Ditylum_brightwellii.AAC.1
MDMQWQNVANHQNGVAILELDPKLEGCKVKLLLLKLEDIHVKNTLTVYSKKEKRIQVAMFPKTANE